MVLGESCGEVAYSITATPVYHNNDPEHENSKFWKYTPCGNFNMVTTNKSAADKYVLGKEFYLDCVFED